MLLIMAVLIAVTVGLAYFTSYELPGSSGIVVVIVPAMDAGQQFFKLEKRRPMPPESWRYATIFVLINLAFSLILLMPFGLLETLRMFMGSLGFPFLLGIFVLVGSLYTAAARMFFAMGAKQQEKQSQSQ
jgi:hypothetical protein